MKKEITTKVICISCERSFMPSATLVMLMRISGAGGICPKCSKKSDTKASVGETSTPWK